MWEEIIKLLSDLLYPLAGIGTLVIIIIVIWFFYPEKVEKWVLLLRKLGAYISEKHEKIYIATHIELKVNEKRMKLCEELGGILPYKLEVEWVDAETLESCLQGDNILIVKMKNHRNQSKNLALAVREYTPNALIPIARKYVEPSLMKAIDYVISKTILSGDTSAFSYFVKMSEQELEGAPNVKETIKRLDKINETGILTRVLLLEYKKLGFLHPADPTDQHYKETSEFERKVYTLVVKKPEEKINISWGGYYLKSAVVPVARDLTVEMYGIQPHIRFIKDSLKSGLKTFYIVAAGKSNTLLAKSILMRVEKELNLQKTYESEYNGYFRDKKMKMFVGVLEERQDKNA